MSGLCLFKHMSTNSNIFVRIQLLYFTLLSLILNKVRTGIAFLVQFVDRIRHSPAQFWKLAYKLVTFRIIALRVAKATVEFLADDGHPVVLLHFQLSYLEVRVVLSIIILVANRLLRETAWILLRLWARGRVVQRRTDAAIFFLHYRAPVPRRFCILATLADAGNSLHRHIMWIYWSTELLESDSTAFLV